MEIRAEFEQHRHESDPKVIKKLLEDFEARLTAKIHPDPYISAKFPGGTGWERNLPPPPNAFTRYELDGQHHHDSHHAVEAVEDLGELSEYAKAGETPLRLSPQARTALSDLAVAYQNQQTYAKLLDDRTHIDPITGKPKLGKNGKPVPSKLEEVVQLAKERGFDLSELETDAHGSPLNDLTPEQTKAFLKEISEGPLYDSLNMQAIGVLEQEVSHARDAKDGIIGR